MAENKTQPTKQSPNAYINAVENDVRRKDAKSLLSIMKKVTGERPVMWGPSIIGFGKYHYTYESGREGDMFLTGFSPRKSNIAVYLMPGFDGKEDMLARLGKHKTGRSCLYINKLADVNLDVLTELIEKDYHYMKAKYDV